MQVEDERFEAAWNQYGPAVLRYCTYSTGSSQEGEDVAAETFVRLFSKGGRVPPEHLEAWLIRVARNLCASHHRAATRRRRLEAQLADDAPRSSTDWVRPDSWEYVRRLKEIERLAVYLRVAEDRSFAEVARILGKSEAAAKMTFYRAIDRLRAEMARDTGGFAATLTGGTENA